MRTHQCQEGKIGDGIDGSADKVEQLGIDTTTPELDLESSPKGGPEGVDWSTSPDRDRDERDSET